MRPAGIFPGQTATVGTRSPPSKGEPFQSRKAPLLFSRAVSRPPVPGRVAPLSLEKTKIVSSASPSSPSSVTSRPTSRSIRVIIAAYVARGCRQGT